MYKPKIIGITGHRPKDLNFEYDLDGPYSHYIGQQIELIIEKESPDKLISGMALGSDQLFAIVGLRWQVPIIAAVPCDGQEEIWSKKSQELYYNILSNPLVEKRVVCPGPYAKWKMQKRNEFIVDNSTKMIAIWNGKRHGGTYNCIEYITKQGKEIIFIDPNEARN